MNDEESQTLHFTAKSRNQDLNKLRSIKVLSKVNIDILGAISVAAL